MLRVAGEVGRSRCSYSQGVDVGDTEVAAVETVGLVDLGEALIAGLDKGDVDAL